MKGRLIVIEGLDGSGKATQAQLLYDRLQKQDAKVKKVSFPDYASSSSSLVKMYLSGEFGNEPNAVNAYAASSFYAVDRYASFKKDWEQFYNEGGVIIADRYTTSNAIHQCSKLSEGQWDSYLEWLFCYEYILLGIPKPDIVIYLNVDTQVSQKLIAGRYQGDESKKDIHERNPEYLESSRTAAVYCSKKMGWKEISCCINGCMKSKEDIYEKIINCLNQNIDISKFIGNKER